LSLGGKGEKRESEKTHSYQFHEFAPPRSNLED